MAHNIKNFSFSTQLVDSIHNKAVCIAIITGKCDQRDTADDGTFDKDYCDLDDVNIIIELGGKRQDNTFAYLVDKQIMENFAYMVDKAIWRHCEMLFEPI